MSHFIGLVFEKDIPMDELIAPYDENIEVDPYIAITVEDKIKELQELHRKSYKRIKESEDKLNAWEQEVLAKGKELSRDDALDSIMSWGYTIKNGNIISTYNPDSKWDWYSTGGRWFGFLINKDGNNVNADYLTNIDLDKLYKEVPFCYITPEGEWVERGEMCWFACVNKEKSIQDWKVEFKNYVESIKDDKDIKVYAIDFHI